MSADSTRSTSPDASGPAPSGERREAISALFREHNRALVQFLLTRLPTESEAKEVAQEAYVRLLQLDQPVAVSFLRWYLFKIAKDIAVDRHRQRTVRERLDQLDGFAELDISSPTENSVMASDELALLLTALRELPRKCQQAFLLQRFRDLTTQQVAATMGLTDRMVRRYMHRALLYCRLRVDGMTREDALREVSHEK
jgi:RNA polymerase sigma factor (sigma-70 family)